MENEWQNYLTKHGATKTDAGNLVFGDPKQEICGLETSAGIVSLDHYGIIRVTGEDAQTFLQGQLTNDITLIGKEKMQLSGYCNPKGRLLAQFLIIPDENGFLLILPRSILEQTLKRLRMFVLRSQLELADISNTHLCIGFTGHNLESILIDSVKPLPRNDFDCIRHKTTTIGKLPGTVDRYICILSIDQAKSLWSELAGICKPMGSSAWQWLDIQSGLPIILPETVEEFVPQMVNLELIDGVNFKKGCYTGQEIVARMHYLGKAKRRMFHFQLENNIAIPAPGTDIFDSAGDTQSVGKVIVAQPSPTQGIELLAVIQLSHLKSTGLCLEDQSGPELTLQTLPYEVNTTG